MKYSEKNTSSLKPVTAFFIALAMILFVYVAFTVIIKVLKVTEYHTFYQLFIIIISAIVVYYLYRYSVTAHEYRIEDDTFFIIREDGSRHTVTAMIKKENVMLLCPVSYDTKGQAFDDYILINACSKPSGRKNGWLIYCVVGDNRQVKVLFDPSIELVRILKELFADKIYKENGDA